MTDTAADDPADSAQAGPSQTDGDSADLATMHVEDAVHVPRSLRNLVLGVVVASIVSAQIGTAFAPSLIVKQPLAMLALNSSNRYLFLVVNQIDAPVFYAVALARRLAPTIAFFAVGTWYGHRATSWVARRDPSTYKMVEVAERAFDRAGWLVVTVFPLPIVTLLAGARRMDPRRMIPLLVVTIAARLVVYRLMGDAAAEPLETAVDWIARWRIPLLVVTFGSVAVTGWSQRKTRARALEELTQLDD